MNQIESKWISINDRLPEDGKSVLTYDADGYYDVGEFCYEKDGVQYFLCGSVIKTISHWMPLPNQPNKKTFLEFLEHLQYFTKANICFASDIPFTIDEDLYYKYRDEIIKIGDLINSFDFIEKVNI